MIRFALLDEPTDVNVWALFDAEGSGYGNYALRWEYWPRLFSLSIPQREFVPMSALGLPTNIIQEGDYYTATVELRPDLRWTDGKPFTAEDAAYTINLVLNFELGFDWKAYYDHDYLDHAQAITPRTIKYFFKGVPNVGTWQYGALLGPIVQKEYWEKKTAQVEGFLPEKIVENAILEAESQQISLQTEVNELNRKLLTIQQSGGQDRQLEAEIKRKQGNLDAANNTLAELTDELRAQFNQARQELYSLDDEDEPTLGNWVPADRADSDWINEMNPDHPFGQPHFDRASFRFYLNEAEAVSALKENEVDTILDPNGLSSDVLNSLSGDDSLQIITNSTSSTRFLIINLNTIPLDDKPLRQAISCLLEGTVFENPALQHSSNLTWYSILDAGWRGQPQKSQCEGLEIDNRLLMAVEIMKTAGYSWVIEPTIDHPGSGLRMPSGDPFTPITLLAPNTAADRIETANLIKELTDRLGIPLAISKVESDEINYRIFSSHRFDLAIFGWKLAGYPAYLCEWFGDPGFFNLESDQINTNCASLMQETNLSSAKQEIDEILSVLAREQPFIPLYAETRTDAYKNIIYPAEGVLDGLGGLYGAPSLALPLP